MKHAVRTADGNWTGVWYAAPSQAIVAHHADFGETLAPVSDLVEDEDGRWTAVDSTAAEIAAGIEVSRFQARAALLQLGKLAAVEQVVAGTDDPLVQMAWAEAVTWRRSSPTIAALASHPLIGLTEESLDNLFIAARDIEA